MSTYAEITAKVNDLKETQRYEKSFDLVREFVAEAGKSDSFTIPLTNEGPFIQTKYNIICSQNSTVQTDPLDASTKKPYCAVKIRFKSQAEGNAQSSDFIPLQLIGTPGLDDMPRYGERPFPYYYPKGDALIIEYDNRTPASLNGEAYGIKNEKISICLTGKIYPMND